MPLQTTFETQFNDILISESNPNTLCANNRDDFKLDQIDSTGINDQAMITYLGYPYRLRFAFLIFLACHAVTIRNCSNPACIATMNDLKSVIPRCATWPGFERWALQFAACVCSGQAKLDLQTVIDSVVGLLVIAPVLYSKDEWPVPQDVYAGSAIFIDWARQMNPWEAFPLLSWLEGLSNDSSTTENRDFSRLGNLDPMMLTDGYRDRTIAQAISRARKLHLCPRRIWTIASSMPGQESNIPALIPDKHSACSYKHKYCSTGPSHKNCTYDYCEISAVNFTNVVQCHRPNCDEKCLKKVFPVHLLDKVANEKRPTAWAIDGKLRPLEAGEPYMAISHVWSDGTGGSGSVNECMYDFFCSVARKLKCKGLWWDAICIPQDKQARAKAISHMHKYYSQAACTIVHDTCLAMSEWAGSEHASFALVMSNWFTRGWTALELARSKRVEVLFSARRRAGYVLKNLDVDIMVGANAIASLSRQTVSQSIGSLRKKHQSKAPCTLNDVLTAIGPRFTSWARDRAIIASQFVGIETPADDQRTIYQQIVCKIGKISTDQLFNHIASPSGPFAWLPPSLFDLPVSQLGPDITVLGDGSLAGEWGIILFPVKFQFSWDAMHPMLRCDIRETLNDDRHIILFEGGKTTITQGLLVKVMKNVNTDYNIFCRYVGPLYFTPQPVGVEDAFGDFYSVLISHRGVDLDAGVSAADHIKGKACDGVVLRN